MSLVEQELMRLDIIDWGVSGSPQNWERAGGDWKTLVDMYWEEVVYEKGEER